MSELSVRRNTILSWIWEIGAMFLSISAMLSAVAILAWMNGQLFSAWESWVSINTTISALATVSRTALAFAVSACIGQQKWNWLRERSDSLTAFSRFDEASRGPWGSTKLLIWLRVRHWAALGALVMIGTLAFDPFLQSVISSRGRLDVAPLESFVTIGRSTSADFGSANFAIASSIYNGFYNSTSFRSQTVGFHCITGNCTWPVFSSLAVCSSCVDVSDHIQNRSYESDTFSYTAYSLSYAQITNKNGRKWNDPSNRTEVFVNSTAHPQDTISFTNKDTLLISFLTMLGAASWRSNQANWNESKPVAYECALLVCANAYKSKVQDGVLEEQIVGSWSQRNPASYYPLQSHYNATELAALEDQLGPSLYKTNDKLTIERTALQITIPEQESTFLPDNDTRVFNFTALDVIGTIDFLRHVSTQEQTWPRFEDEKSGPSVPQILGESTNITQTFERVAKSITDQIRDLAASSVSGTAYQWQTHVDIFWGKFAIPGLMIVMGCVYVVLTIIQSRRLDLPAWKEYTLPTLIHGFDDDSQTLLRDMQSDPKATKAAESVVVQFCKEQNRLRIASKHEIYHPQTA